MVPRPTILSWAFMNQTTFPSLVLCLTSRRWFGPQRTTGVRPVELLCEHPIEILDEVQQLASQVGHRAERPTSDHLPHNHPEDRFDLVQPRTVLGRVHEPNPVAPLRQERLSARHRFHTPTTPLLPQC